MISMSVTYKYTILCTHSSEYILSARKQKGLSINLTQLPVRPFYLQSDDYYIDGQNGMSAITICLIPGVSFNQKLQRLSL